MADAEADARRTLLYHFCHLQLPAVGLPPKTFRKHLDRTYQLFQAKQTGPVVWPAYLDGLYAIDWFLCCGCLESQARAWEVLFASRTGRSDALLVDALRARAVRLYPRDDEKQDSAVTEFWSQLLVSDSPESPPVLARYDGQRPLVPWLIRVFQNLHLSRLRQHGHTRELPEDDLALPLPGPSDGRWHEAFVAAAREALAELADAELLILGLRMRYRLSQREVASLLGIHEGNVSRQTGQLRERCLTRIGERLLTQGWTGDDLAGFVQTEMGSVLMDDPRLSADRLASILAARGRELPEALRAEG
jgi:RNA polymerase sigma factor (sigma-70 family)